LVTCLAPPLGYTTIYTSGLNTAAGCAIGTPCPATRVPFKSIAPRPIVPDLLFREFNVPDTAATHVRLVVLDNQCTGAPEYAGDQDPGDLSNNPDCKTSIDSTAFDDIAAAELEVFEFNTPLP
jgi:hypothetical protein